MSWTIPGQSATVEIDGVTVTIKSLTVADRAKFAEQLKDLAPDGKAPEQAALMLEGLYDAVAGCIEKINGPGFDCNAPETVKDALQYQPLDVINKLMAEIMGASSITGEPEKN